MKYILPIPSLLALVLCLAGCEKGRLDAYYMGMSDLSSTGKDGTNLAVTEENKLEVSQLVISQVYGALRKVTAQNYLYLNADSLAEFDFRFRSLGTNHGYVDTRGNVIPADLPDVINYDIYISFINYSDSGAIFLGGGLHLKGKITRTNSIRTVTVFGFLDFTGKYASHVDFSYLNLPLDPSGKLMSVWSTLEELGSFTSNGNLTLVSDGELYWFNPYFRVPAPE